MIPLSHYYKNTLKFWNWKLITFKIPYPNKIYWKYRWEFWISVFGFAIVALVILAITHISLITDWSIPLCHICK